MKRFGERLKAFVRHPGTQLFVGLVLLVSGITEVVYDFWDAEHAFRLGAHHGVALFGLAQVLGSLPDAIEGIDRAFEAVDQHKEQKRNEQERREESGKMS